MTTQTSTGAVTSITEARSFTGAAHVPDWVDFTVVCNDADDAARLVALLRESSLAPLAHDAAVTVRIDRNQPTQADWPTQIAFIATAWGLAPAEEIIDSLLVLGVA